MLQQNLKLYELNRTTLTFKSADNLLKNQEQKLNSELQRKNMQLAVLEDSVRFYHRKVAESANAARTSKTENVKLSKQLNAIDPSIAGVGVSTLYSPNGAVESTVVVTISATKRLSGSAKSQVERFLKIQYAAKKVMVVYE